MNHRVIKDITNFIFMSDMPEKSDIIFVPGTSKSAIIEKAAQLYCAGYAKYLLPSGMYSSNVGRFASENIDNPRYAGEYDTDFEYCKYILMEHGVPECAIIREEHATNSMENAEFSANVLKELGMEVKRPYYVVNRSMPVERLCRMYVISLIQKFWLCQLILKELHKQTGIFMRIVIER